MARIVFMGTPEFAVPTLEALIAHHEVVAVVTQPDRRGGRGRRQLAAPPVKEAALAAGLTVLQPPTLRNAAVVDQLRQLAPEVVVVAAFGQILRSNVLAIPARGCLNVHASLLPRYRGASPITAAILAGESETGVTIMLMDRGMDTGPVLAQARAPITDQDTTGSLTGKLAALGAELLVETLPRWLGGEIEPQPQDEALATYCRPVDKSEGCIAWGLPAVQIARMVRAYDPWPGTFTGCGGRMLKIVRARALPGWRGDAEPGTVVEVSEGIAVATGEGALLIEELQPAGKRAMACEAYICGQRDFVGSRLEAA